VYLVHSIITSTKLFSDLWGSSTSSAHPRTFREERNKEEAQANQIRTEANQGRRKNKDRSENKDRPENKDRSENKVRSEDKQTGNKNKQDRIEKQGREGTRGRFGNFV
jgi:hypothetical protein